MVRIRYKEQELGKWVSTRPVLIDGDAALVTLDSNSVTYTIVSVDGVKELAVGTASNLHALKKEVKAALVNLGATFTLETRTLRSAQASEVVNG